MNKELNELIESWLKIDPNEESRNEIKQLVNDKDYNTLTKKMIPRIAFGTAGLRSSMESGYAHMNDVTVLQASQGLIAFILTKDFTKPSIVIGHDHRFNSKRFAEILASVAVVKHVKVYYLDLVHTPLVPFAIDNYSASCGVMITASHNPAKDNGYKVYYSNGCQIIPPIDKEISDSIDENLIPWENVWNTKEHLESVVHVKEETTNEYIKQVNEKLIRHKDLNFNFVYTPMHGVGLDIFEKIMPCFNSNWKIVPEQAKPDPKFPTVTFPNPEESGALDLAIEYAKKLNYRLVIANDPDADRFSVAVNTKKGWKQLNGNEIGFLFAMYVNAKKDDYLINSTVSSRVLKSMSEIDGFNYIDTLTGFKWIGNKAIDLENGFKVPFAYEEAIGFMFELVHDKDGISAAIVFLQLYQEWFREHDVLDKLEEGYNKYGWFKSYNGYYRTTNVNQVFESKVRRYTGDFPKTLGDFKVIEWIDLTLGYQSNTKDNKPILPTDPNSQLITGILKLKKEDDEEVRFTCRGSGTEPKLKVYIEGKSNTEDRALGIAIKCWDLLKNFWFDNLEEVKPNI
ncbi:unnamed protein product [Candida verbasci]|uniref:Phosphoribomutase n=1 Tax=Candida verbasci TaxID=1227364 RepID=A0A9W4TXT5_9ASCO|nr:unnamed protein product [Candida verbasci]